MYFRDVEAAVLLLLIHRELYLPLLTLRMPRNSFIFRCLSCLLFLLFSKLAVCVRSRFSFRFVLPCFLRAFFAQSSSFLELLRYFTLPSMLPFACHEPRVLLKLTPMKRLFRGELFNSSTSFESLSECERTFKLLGGSPSPRFFRSRLRSSHNAFTACAASNSDV